MKTMRKMNRYSNTTAKGWITGTVVSLLVTVIGVMISAVMTDREYIQWKNIGYWVLGTIIVSSFAGTKISMGKVRANRWFVCLVSGVLYWSSLMILNALLFGGQYEACGVTFLLIACGSICAGLSRRETGPVKRKFKGIPAK